MKTPVRSPSGPSRARARRPAHPDLRDLWLIGGIATGTLLGLLIAYPARGFVFPVGPDAPVYVWWASLADAEGLSAIGHRPGLPALTVLLSGTLGLSVPQLLAGLGAALAAVTGLAAGALVLLAREPTPSTTHASPSRAWEAPLATLLAGAMAVQLAGGYFASLALMALLLGAAALLAVPTRRSTVAAGLALGAALLAHPPVFPLAAAILLGTAGLGWFQHGSASEAERTVARGEAGRIGAAVAAGSALGGAGLVALLAAGDAFRPDTSKDGFLRRAGLTASLQGDYLERLGRHWARYALPLSVPLAAWGATRANGYLRRLLWSWGAVVVAGTLAALITGFAPPVRFLAFAYVIPIGTALAIPALGSILARRRRWLAALACTAILGALLAGAVFAWVTGHPFTDGPEVRAAVQAGRVASSAPPGTPLVFVVPNRGAGAATRVANVIRAAVPSDRIRDVFVFPGRIQDYLAGRPTLVGHPDRDALSRLYLRDIREAGARRVGFVLEPFADPAEAAPQPGSTTGPVVVAPGVRVIEGFDLLGAPSPEGAAPLEVFEPWTAVLAGIALAVLFTAVGLGWSLLVVPRPVAPLLAPVFGLGGLLLVGVGSGLAGIRLSGPGGPLATAALGALGYGLVLARRRRALGLERDPGSEPAPQVEE